MKYRIPFILFLCLFSITVLACDQSNLPIDLLGKELNQIRQKFTSVTPDADFSDEFWNGKIDERWLVIDRSRHFLTLHTVDGFISELFVSDNLYSTPEKIRVGDSFSKIFSAYPDISFRVGTKDVASGIYDLVTRDRKTTFWFDAIDIRKMITEGKKVEVGDEIVQKMELTLIHIVE